MIASGAIMLPLDRALTLTMGVLAAATLGGVLVRAKVRACRLFPTYLATAGAGHLLIGGWPTVFWHWPFLAVTDAVQMALRLAIALEITRKTFRPYPRGYLRAHAILGVTLLGILLVVVHTPRHFGDAYELARTVERVSYAAGLLFLAYVGTARYYDIPLDPFHRAIATGFGIVTVLVGSVSLLWRFDPAFGLGRDFIVKTAYPCVLAFWLVSAWRRDDFGGLSPETLRRIHPWRVT